MKERMAYEQTIAGKLEALPLPDMADAIWARIETQLDLELPTDDGPGGDAPNFPTGGFFIGGIGLIVFAVLIYFFSNSKIDQPTTSPFKNHTTTAPQTIENNTTKPPDKNNATRTPVVNNFTPALNQAMIPAADSMAMAQQPAVIKPDSAFTLPPFVSTAPTSTLPKTDTVKPIKKPRGVTGLSDDDYRVVPKKDSAGN